jgi:small-conductance mechanosensitive channel
LRARSVFSWQRLVALVLLLGASGVARAAEPPVEAPATSGAPVVVINRTVMVLRASFMGVTAAERAEHAEQRLSELLERGGSGDVRSREEPQGAVLYVNGAFAMVLTPGDADPSTGQTLRDVTTSAIANVKLVMAETREARDRRHLLRAAVRSGAATVAFLLAVFLVRRARRWLVLKLAQLLERGTSRVQVAGARLLQTTRLVSLSSWLVSAVSWLLRGLLAYRWLVFVLNEFPYTRPWSEELDGFLLGIVGQVAGGIVRALPDLTIAFVIFLLARGVVAALKPFWDGLESGRLRTTSVDPNTAHATRRIFTAAVWLFAAVMAYPYLPGSGSEAFKGMSVVLGLVFTLGGSSVFGQAASGLILMYSRTVRVGEYVRIGDQEGTVTELGAFTTKLWTGMGDEVILPNSTVLGTVTKNYSRPSHGDGTLLDTSVTIGYDAPWRQVEGMLIEAARRTSGVLAAPEPHVFKTKLNDFYVEYRLVCLIARGDPEARPQALSALNANVLDVFNAYGVQIMSPHFFGDPASPKVVPKSAWHSAPAKEPEATDATGTGSGA